MNMSNDRKLGWVNWQLLAGIFGTITLQDEIYKIIHFSAYYRHVMTLF